MPRFWSHRSSVTRDFVMLSVAIVFIALLASLWLAYATFREQSEQIAVQLEQEASRIDRTFNEEINRATYLLEAIGRQIVRRKDRDKQAIAEMLGAYESDNDFYSIFLWVDEKQQVITSSRQGVLDTPVDLSDRDYIFKSPGRPFQVQVGQPIHGRVSHQYVLPMGMGLTDFTGKYIGTVTLSLNLHTITRVLQNRLHHEQTEFAIATPGLFVLSRSDSEPSHLSGEFLVKHLDMKTIKPGDGGVIASPGLFSENRVFAYYYYSKTRPYIFVTAYESNWSALNELMLPRLLQLVFAAAFLLSLLWLVRFRIIFPVQTLVDSATEIARGNTKLSVPRGGPLEISNLSSQLQNIADYITERKRIEEELIAKVLALKTAKDIAEVSDKAKMEILASLKGEIYPAIEQILGAASILQEQPYGPIKGKEYKASIKQLDENSTHLTEAIHEVFEFPKMGHADTLTATKPVDVSGLVHKCVNLLSATRDKEEVSITINIQDDLPKLGISELHLTHVIMHLLIACLHSIPAGGELTIEAALEESEDGDSEDTEFALFFKDNGTGLDTQHIANLWRASEQGRPLHVHATRDEGTDSAYAAIALTKKIITLHDGRMTMQNPQGAEAIIAIYFKQ